MFALFEKNRQLAGLSVGLTVLGGASVLIDTEALPLAGLSVGLTVLGGCAKSASVVQFGALLV